MAINRYHDCAGHCTRPIPKHLFTLQAGMSRGRYGKNQMGQCGAIIDSYYKA